MIPGKLRIWKYENIFHDYCFEKEKNMIMHKYHNQNGVQNTTHKT